jgi:hypothetical protein
MSIKELAASEIIAMPAQDPFQVAVIRASSAFGDDAWNRLDAAERSFAIRQELRRLDAEQVALWSRQSPMMRGIASDNRVWLQGAPDDRSRRARPSKNRCARKANAPPVMVARGAEAYRIVVRSKQFGRRTYRWEIVEDTTNNVIRQSTAWYGSMEQAYECGAAELSAFRDGRSRRTLITDKEHYGLPRFGR